MGFGGINVWQLLIVLAIVIMIFGTKKLRNMGGDFGSAIKGFKNAMDSSADKSADKDSADKDSVDKDSADKKLDDSASNLTANKDSAKQKDKS